MADDLTAEAACLSDIFSPIIPLPKKPYFLRCCGTTNLLIFNDETHFPHPSKKLAHPTKKERKIFPMKTDGRMEKRLFFWLNGRLDNDNTFSIQWL